MTYKTILEKIKAHLPQILTISIYLALFASLVFPYRDKDWGWHYQYGKYLLENGHILVRDIYSWTMATYAWINHSWLFDPILYFLFNTVGFMGLSLIGAAICALVFYLLVGESKLKYWQVGIAAFFFGSLMETGIQQGLRSQILALLPLGFLMYVLKKGRDDPKLFSWIPLIMFIWVNLHGTFAFGMAILGVFFASYFFEFKEYRTRLITTFLITFFLTLWNPFTFHSYLEVVRHTGSPYLQNVTEWLPIYAGCVECHVPTFGAYLLILIAAAFVKPQKSEIPYFLIVLGLTYQTIMARRYLPLFAVSTFPLFVDFIGKVKFKFLDLDSYKITPYLTVLAILMVVMANLFGRLPSYNFYRYGEKDFCGYLSGCPMEALKYLKSNPPQGNGINFYDWGGYMIGRGFPAKLFVDGRMHLWDVHGYSAFGDYIKMNYHHDTNLFNKYDLDWALVQPDSEITKMIEGGEAGMWRLIYFDDVSKYYVRIR